MVKTDTGIITIAMYDNLAVRFSRPDSHHQSVQREFARKSGLHRPASDVTGEEIDNHRQIQPALPDPYVISVTHTWFGLTPVNSRCTLLGAMTDGDPRVPRGILQPCTALILFCRIIFATLFLLHISPISQVTVDPPVSINAATQGLRVAGEFTSRRSANIALNSPLT